jgi:hypothetical protein
MGLEKVEAEQNQTGKSGDDQERPLEWVPVQLEVGIDYTFWLHHSTSCGSDGEVGRWSRELG